MSSDPYEVLGLGRHADEAEVRRRYLDLVRQHPPDRAPERFAEIREAYERVRDPAVRLESQLFQPGSNDSIDAIAAELRARLASARLPLDLLAALADAP